MKKFSWPYWLAGVLLFFSLVLTVHILRAIVRPAASPEANLSKTKGPQDAPIQIVEYSDFQCPACQAIQSFLESLLTKYPGKIQLIFRHFPLPGHSHSVLAHMAAECAARQEKFWAYHDVLFQEQPAWSAEEEPLERFFLYAKAVNLNIAQFAACLGTPEIIELVRKEKRQGDRSGVRSTPSFLIEGRLFAGAQQMLQAGEPFIQKEITRKGGEE